MSSENEMGGLKWSLFMASETCPLSCYAGGNQTQTPQRPATIEAYVGFTHSNFACNFSCNFPRKSPRESPDCCSTVARQLPDCRATVVRFRQRLLVLRIARQLRNCRAIVLQQLPDCRTTSQNYSLGIQGQPCNWFSPG
jgi:hypothetical protein